MENAVKALLIAAGVFMGLMILSLGISLYASLSGYVEGVQEEIASTETQQFNEQFTKYINYDKDTKKKSFTLTIQDIVTAANTAYENNKKYELTDYEGNNYYVIIKMPGYDELEKNINTVSAEILAGNLGKEYICSTEDVKINATTGRVYQVEFHEYDEP